MPYQLTITVTTHDKYDTEADISLAFDPPITNKENEKPSTVEIYGAVVLKAITQRSDKVSPKKGRRADPS